MRSSSEDDIKALKARIRQSVWKQMEEENIARFPRPVYGRIPNFADSEIAASKLVNLPQFERAKVVKVNPDAPQRMIRYHALASGKVLVTPTPRLREGFLLLDPRNLSKREGSFASTIAGSFKYGKKVDIDELPKVDLIVVGCVAVSPSGARLGKGEGYGEIEYALLREKNRVSGMTPVLTTVHDVQVVEDIPWEEHDLSVDVIVTPQRTLSTNSSYPKPRGIMWERLTKQKIQEIPILARLSHLNE